MFEFLKKRKSQEDQLPIMREVGLPEVRIMPLDEPGFHSPVMTEIQTPDTLRRDLFDAVLAKDDEKLCSLCQKHEKNIFEIGMIWSKVPAEFRANPRLLKWYGDGLKAIARFCAERLGKPELLEHIKQIESLPNPTEKPPAAKSNPKL